MRTRHILTAMVLPAFIAACTADDFVENNSINLDGRAELAPITFTVGGDADTRFIYDETGNGNWKWESAKDAFSAFLVDYNGTPVDQLYTNYIYKSADGAKYETTSKMVEGIYWFYAPAEENKNTRDLLPFKLEASQDADYYKSDDAKVFFTGLYKLTKDDNPQNINLSLMNYYSRAVFPLKNNTDGAVTIKQIILKGSKNFQVEGAISTKALANYMYGFTKEGEMVSVKNLDKDPKNDETIAELKARLQTADLAVAPAEGTIKTSPALVLNLGDGVSIAKGATESFTMLVPRTEANVSCEIMIITDKGVINITAQDQSNYAKNVQFKHNGIMPMFGLQSNNTFKAYSMEKTKFEDLEDAYYVSSYDDMMALINTVNGEIQAYNFGDWSVDAAMASAITNSDAEVVFKQPIEIKDTKKAVSLTKVAFVGGVTVAKGTEVTFASVEKGIVTNTVEGDFTVAEGASATLVEGDFAKAKIDNKGTLKVTEKAVMKAPSPGTEIAEIESTGALTLEDNKDVVIALNGGSLNYTTAKKEKPYLTYTVKNSLTLPLAADLKNDITITVGKNVTLSIDETLTAATNKVGDETYKTNIVNNGTINVAASQILTANGDLTNNGTIETLTGATGFVIGGSATNAAGAVIKGVATTIGKNATLNNSGKIEGTTVTNNGTIIAASGSRTTVTAGTGIIDNTALAFVSPVATQVVTYVVTDAVNNKTLTELNTLIPTYKITKLIFKNMLTVDNASMATANGITAVEFAAGSGIDVKATSAIDFAKVAEVTVSSNVTFSGFEGTETIKFSADATKVTVKKNCTLTIADVTVTSTASKTTFISEDKEAGDPDTTVRGQVVNNGTVKGAAVAYDGTTEPLGQGWWTGSDAATAI